MLSCFFIFVVCVGLILSCSVLRYIRVVLCTFCFTMSAVHLCQVESNYTIDIKCKPAYHRFLIGRGGANVRKVSLTWLRCCLLLFKMLLLICRMVFATILVVVVCLFGVGVVLLDSRTTCILQLVDK